MSSAIRALSIDAIEKAGSGHPGMPLGMADVATILFKDFLKFDPKNPNWPSRDRFILSAGHGSMLLYSLLYLCGYEDMTIDQIKNFRQLNYKTAGHPEYGHANGIETTTGPLGQGVANAVGFAVAEQISAAKFGKELINNYTYVIAGDGCIMEGISYEAIALAGHLSLEKLILLWDNNSITIDGDVSLSSSEDQVARFKACGWDVQEIDGHDYNQIYQAIQNAQNSDKPSMIACKTIIGYGAPNKAGKSSSHGAPLGKDEVAAVKKHLDWQSEEFVIDEHILNDWRAIGKENHQQYLAWQQNKIPADFQRILSKDLPSNFLEKITALKQDLTNEQPKIATRQASHRVLEMLSEVIPELIGGSADLTGSNLTKTNSQEIISKQNFAGNYLNYGIREHAMAGIMNGLNLYGSLIPYGGTFLIFSDYCRPAIRLAALMQIQTIYVMTHDSIGLGEDGPTHQPVEHLASLRAIPNLQVLRPADAVETLEAWQIALESKNTPTVLALTRQKLKNVRKEFTSDNLCRRGAYILKESKNADIAVTIFASGSEVNIALAAKEKLENENIGTRVVSVPCFELFDQQDSDYKVNLLCNNSIKVAIEAASSFGWNKFIASHGIFVGMQGFGASAPAGDLYEYFNITVEEIYKKVKNKIK
ncbi:MAG: transketolase [Pseudomonadota bacterium]